MNFQLTRTVFPMVTITVFPMVTMSYAQTTQFFTDDFENTRIEPAHVNGDIFQLETCRKQTSYDIAIFGESIQHNFSNICQSRKLEIKYFTTCVGKLVSLDNIGELMFTLGYI